MRDEECIKFLQWAVPQLQMRWPGFRKVRGQVCKRLQRRLNELALNELDGYRDYLARHHDEWQNLDGLCRITISRFYRDKMMFAFLEDTVLPELAQRVLARREKVLRIWCVGAGSGEEPYSLSIIWHLKLKNRFPDLKLQIVATDSDPNMIQRSHAACYEYGSIKNLPQDWQSEVFVQQDERYCLKPQYQANVEFVLHDVREEPTGMLYEAAFDLVLCRNLVFTYFDEPLQLRIFDRICHVLAEGGALVIGIHEFLPQGVAGIRPWSERLRVFERC
jgi:chemotaxis protein methyltransferase CheR